MRTKGHCHWPQNLLTFWELCKIKKVMVSSNVTSFASQTHCCKKGKGLDNYVCKPCPTTRYSVVQSHCSIFSHDTLNHSKSSLEDDGWGPEHLLRYCRCLYISGSMCSLQQLFQKRIIEIWLWAMACIPHLPFCRSEFARLVEKEKIHNWRCLE